MKKLKVPIVNKSRHPMPEYATPQSAGLDVRANIDEDIRVYKKTEGGDLTPPSFSIQLSSFIKINE
jgi:dUTPase